MSGKGAQTRKKLLDAAQAELVEAGGNLEVAAVARRAGTSIGLTYRYFQAHIPGPCDASGWPRGSIPHAGVTMTGDLSMLQSGVMLPKSGASRTSIATYVHPVRVLKPSFRERTMTMKAEEQQLPRPRTA